MMTPILLVSFVILLLLGASHFYRAKFKLSKIPFTYWWHTHQVCLWVILSVGLIQVHFNCMSLWGDCYARNYPFWVMDFKPLLLNATNIWSFFAIIAIAKDIYVIFSEHPLTPKSQNLFADLLSCGHFGRARRHFFVIRYRATKWSQLHDTRIFATSFWRSVRRSHRSTLVL